MPVNETIVSDPDTAPTRMINIYLVPREQGQTGGDNPVAGENPYLTSEAEYGKMYPTDAVKAFKAGKKGGSEGKMDDAIGYYEKADFNRTHVLHGSEQLGYALSR